MKLAREDWTEESASLPGMHRPRENTWQLGRMAASREPRAQSQRRASASARRKPALRRGHDNAALGQCCRSPCVCRFDGENCRSLRRRKEGLVRTRSRRSKTSWDLTSRHVTLSQRRGLRVPAYCPHCELLTHLLSQIPIQLLPANRVWWVLGCILQNRYSTSNTHSLHTFLHAFSRLNSPADVVPCLLFCIFGASSRFHSSSSPSLYAPAKRILTAKQTSVNPLDFSKISDICEYLHLPLSQNRALSRHVVVVCDRVPPTRMAAVLHRLLHAHSNTPPRLLRQHHFTWNLLHLEFCATCNMLSLCALTQLRVIHFSTWHLTVSDRQLNRFSANHHHA